MFISLSILDSKLLIRLDPLPFRLLDLLSKTPAVH